MEKKGFFPRLLLLMSLTINLPLLSGISSAKRAQLQHNFNNFKSGINCFLTRKPCTKEEKEALWTAGKAMLWTLGVGVGTYMTYAYWGKRSPTALPIDKNVFTAEQVIARYVEKGDMVVVEDFLKNIVTTIEQEVDKKTLDWPRIEQKLKDIGRVKKEINENASKFVLENILKKVRDEKGVQLQEKRDELKAKRTQAEIKNENEACRNLTDKWDVIFELQKALGVPNLIK